MTIEVNGERREAPEGMTVLGLLEELGLQSVLAEHNGTALHRAEWAAVTLAQGDRLELVQIVAGG